MSNFYQKFLHENMYLIDPLIDNFYGNSHEESRLMTGLGPLEFERNKALITSYLKPKSRIADIGGGPGHYAQWLAQLGHQVTLIDPVKKHIRQATRRSENSEYPFEVLQAEARALPIEDRSQDLVILHGPLYHLQGHADRVKAITEAKRIVNKGGVVLGFAISHTASLISSLQSGLIHHDQVFEMCEREMKSGSHFPAKNFPGMLPKAFFHRPAGLQEEFEVSGLRITALKAVEGMAWLDGKFFVSWADPEKRKRLMEVIELTENDAELLCFSPHMMLAAERID